MYLFEETNYLDKTFPKKTFCLVWYEFQGSE